MISSHRVLYHFTLFGLLVLAAACSRSGPPGSDSGPLGNPVGPASPLSVVTSQPTSSPIASPTLAPAQSPAPEPTANQPAAAVTAPPAAPATPTTQPPSPTSAISTQPTPSAIPVPTFTPQPAPSPIPQQPAFPPAIALEPVLGGLRAPVYLTVAGQDGSGAARLFVVEKVGRISLVENGVLQPTPFLDISDRVGSQASEQGLLSVAFPPDFADSGLLYVDYTDLQGDTVIARFELLAGDPRRADPGSEQKLLQIDQPAANHNGGQLQFGPDGYLYIGMGDGGAAGDPWGNAQNPGVLLGKLLRIDLNGAGTYTAPNDNPWLDQPGARPELWAIGLRNPWRFSFDRVTGDLYIADVGQNLYEEVNFQPASSAGGENYGWDVMEGEHCFEPSGGCDTQGLVLPIAEYDHGQGCSITGGYLYRGAEYPQMAGVYFFGDYCSGIIWGLRQATGGEWQMAFLLDTDISISSFGEDAAGEIYVVSYREGIIYHLVAAP